MTSSRIRFLAATAVSVPLLFAGCGSDDDSSADDQAVCDNFIAVDVASNTGEAEPDEMNAQLDIAIAAADDDVAATLTTLKTEAQPLFVDPESEPSDEFFSALGEMYSWVGDNCDVETLDVTAKDYEFDGVPDEVATGYTVVSFENQGEEQHEMAVVRINDGVTESIEELLALPEEESGEKVTFTGATYAPPGESSAAGLSLTEPGNYVMLCFIPVGSVGEAEGDGPPHFTEGMIHQFTVTS